MSAPRIDVIIPVLDEEESLPALLASLPRPPVRRVVVVDNGSSDRSAEVARAAGAEVVCEPRRGYGSACRRGLDYVAGDPPNVVVFLDADGSDDPGELPRLLAPILEGRAELAIGSRLLGRPEPGALNLAQRLGGWVAGWALGVLFGRRFTDLGPFRAVRYEALRGLGMRDPTWGWTVEMQARACAAGWEIVEVPVRYRCRRAGRSKISGSPAVALRAAARILWTLARLARSARRGSRITPGPHPDRGSSPA